MKITNLNKASFKRKNNILLTAICIATTGSPVGYVYAQAGGQQLEELLVTATRRTQNLQEVPIAITAITSEDLIIRGVANIGNLNALVPNLSVMGGGNSGESQASFRVRGMPGVAFYVDGINQSSTDGLLTMGVVEVERVEVLRGPQGTLFGNASLGGAINYVTKAPAAEAGARLETSVGSFNRRDVVASFDLPLTSTLFSKFTLASMKRDGFVDSVEIERSYGDVNDELFRADFLWTPKDNISVRYNFEKNVTDRNGPARVVWEIGPMKTFTVGGIVSNTNPNAQVYKNANNYDYTTKNSASGQGGVLSKYDTRVAWENNGLVIDLERHSLDMTWDINDSLKVRSLTGYKEITRGVQVDFDGDANVIILERDNRIKRYDGVQELQLLGSFRENINFVLGGYWEQSNVRSRTVTWGLPEYTCDLWNAANLERVTAAERAQCFSNRKLALGVTNPAITTNAQLTALKPNLQGVTQGTFSGAAGSNSDQMNYSKPETSAYFGDVTWNINDQFTLVLGARVSEDTDINSIVLRTTAELAGRAKLLPDTDIPGYFGAKIPLPAPTGTTTYEATTMRASLSYEMNDDIMLYAGYANGYGPGGQSQTSTSIISYMQRGVAEKGIVSDIPATVDRPEQTVKSFEAGLRADWLDSTVRTNLTVFKTDWSNVPVSQYVATKFWDVDGNNAPDSIIDIDGIPGPDIFFYPSLWTVPVAEAIADGFELETVWLPTDQLRFDFNLGFLKTEYTSLGTAGKGAVPAVSSGSQFAGAPEITASLAARYDITLSNGAILVPALDYTYTDKYTLQTGEILQRTQPAYGMLNGRIAYSMGDDWTVALNATNLTNEYYFNSGFFTKAEQIHFMTVGRPREWGLTFNMNF